jgi:cullin 3
MVTLLLFENLGEGKNFTYEEIKDATAIPDNEQRNLRVRSSRGLRNTTWTGSQPRGFVLVQRRFLTPITENQISTVLLRRASRAAKSARNACLKACIIRIMKAHKEMTHNKLVSETTRQLGSRFLPDPMSIKKRTEALI